ncbi:Dam family site-specific DNA-(adenine-N6)-methyltransferase [Lacticaseibacillus sp. GG6-2]
MRFIGSKTNLLPQIAALLAKHVDGSERSFVDLFGGSNAVGQYFKQQYQVISNDIMYFSYVIARASIQLNQTPAFAGLRRQGIPDPLRYLQATPIEAQPVGYVASNYSPLGEAKRMYFTPENARRIDFIRETIEAWKQADAITEDEYFYLLDALIQGIPYVSNITGTYGAYLKHWDKRAYKPIELIPSAISDNGQANRAFNVDALKLIHELEGDIVYIDTPYNSRQYAPNYHVLESIAAWDKQPLHGVTGQRDNTDEKSLFAMKTKARAAMETLFADLKFRHVVVSYSTDGILPEAELREILEVNAVPGTLEVVRIPYRKYKSKIVNEDTSVAELLFYFQSKKAVVPASKPRPVIKASAPKQAGGFIKSPLNYVGGKYKLLPQLLPLFPPHINTFVDLFSGGGNVGINVDAKQVIFNDNNVKINELFRYFQGKDPEALIAEIEAKIAQYHLSKTNQEGFLQFRVDYNADPKPIDLYTLVAYSFNYQFRFNNERQYNNPFGRNRSHFSERMAANLRRFVTRLNSIDAVFTDDYFTDFDLDQLTPGDFVYADPPYLITTGSYNDGNRGFVNWTAKQEQELYAFLDELNARHIKFALSNVTEHKGRVNDSLIAWCEQYHIHELSADYSNASHNTTHAGSREVLITNY